jgi:hypothetical protein
MLFCRGSQFTQYLDADVLQYGHMYCDGIPPRINIKPFIAVGHDVPHVDYASPSYLRMARCYSGMIIYQIPDGFSDLNDVKRGQILKVSAVSRIGAAF